VVSLALHLQGSHHGTVVSAKVVRVASRKDDPIWKFDVGVQFQQPLDDALVGEIERRAAGS
jgi:hypothetical protein